MDAETLEGHPTQHDDLLEPLAAHVPMMAAAGNHVRIITAPASYDNCIAVAATGRDSTPWDGSSRGRDVEVEIDLDFESLSEKSLPEGSKGF